MLEHCSFFQVPAVVPIGTFESMIFPFPMMGHVSSLERIFVSSNFSPYRS